MSLDELLPDDYELQLFHWEYDIPRICITGKDLKDAIRSEINQMIFDAIKDGVRVGNVRRMMQ